MRLLVSEQQTLVWKKLENDGYAVVNDGELGFSPGMRQHLKQQYFNNRVLRRYPGDMPMDRQRARDVVHYAWNNAPVPALREHQEIAIENRGGYPGRREYDRTSVVGDPVFARWIQAALALIPPARRHQQGTFGVNMFRTFTNVVTAPHQDGEQFIFVYVVDKNGGGAETTLYEPGESTPFFRHELPPGAMIVFEDARFRHGATPLTSPLDGIAHRDALVCTVDYPTSRQGEPVG